jgi:uncharacterized protein YeaO (DUF488 family)
MAQGTEQRAAELDEWCCTQVAPSDALRKWYGHDPEKFEEFGSRHRTEIHEPERASALQREVFSCTATIHEHDAALLLAPDGFQIYLIARRTRAEHPSGGIGPQYLI